jgi:oligopeptide transport system substrate-binding protein
LIRGRRALLGGLAVVVVALVGCSTPQENGSQAVSVATHSPGMEPGEESAVQRVQITLPLGVAPATLDSVLATDSASITLLTNVMEGLVRLGPDGRARPGVAESWHSPDGLTYTFRLREDARWSDGEPVTARDFKNAWLRALDPARGSAYSYQFYLIDGAEAFHTLDPLRPGYTQAYEQQRDAVAIAAPDDRTLTVRLMRPAPYWLSLTAFPTYLPQAQHSVSRYGGGYGSAPDRMLYNGPFRITRWEPESQLGLTRNEAYWDATSVRLEQVLFRIVPDAMAAVSLYERGQLDRAPVPAQSLPRFRNKGLHQTVSTTTTFLSLNLEHPLLGDLRVRRALHLAIDRSSLCSGVLGYDAVPAEGLIPPGIMGDGVLSFRQLSGSHLRVTGNQMEAQRLWETVLGDLGYTDVDLTILHADLSVTRQQVRAIAEMLERSLPGLTVRLEAVSLAERLQRGQTGLFDLLFQTWPTDFDDPLALLEYLVTESPFNHGRWTEPRYDALIEEARSSGENPLRMRAMADAERLLMSDLPILPLYHSAVNWVTRPAVKGLLDLPLTGSIDVKGASLQGRP